MQTPDNTVIKSTSSSGIAPDYLAYLPSTGWSDIVYPDESETTHFTACKGRRPEGNRNKKESPMKMHVTTWNTKPYSTLTGKGLTWEESFSMDRLMEFMEASKFPITLQKNPMLWVFIYGMSEEEGRALMESAPKEPSHIPVPPIFPEFIASKPTDPLVNNMKEEFLQAINQADTVEKLNQLQSEWLGPVGKVYQALRVPLCLRRLALTITPERVAEQDRALRDLEYFIKEVLIKKKGI